MAKLGELYKITSGGTPSRTHSEYYEDGTIPWVKTGDLKDKYLFETDEKISQLGLENSSARIYLKNTVLLAMYGATIGATSILKIDAATNQACAAFSPRKDTLPEYLYAFLESQKDKFIKDAVGGAQPNLSAGYLKTIEFKLPSLEQQTRITRNLSKIDELLLLRKQQLAKLDELVKVRFVEMFGDPIGNTKNLPVTKFVDVVKMQRGFDLPVQERKSDGMIPVYGSNGVLGYHDISKVKGGGVITGRSGTIGKVFYEKGEFWPLNTTLFSLNSHGNDVVYLKYLLELFDLSRFTEGTGVPTLNRNKFHDELIIDVPLDEQERFAAFVERVDQQKQTVQQSLEKLELMKKALMQEYFG
ncbi:restriction endonuclease subunit S [Faecalibacterium taiwanense]|uniref:restriction endonuclease subunit S n=1 Tax=Faecalibacterium taiwanense TaxID=3030638 RepID=UPI003AAAD99F